MMSSPAPARRWVRALLLVTASTLALVIGLSGYVYWAYIARDDATQFDDAIERYKYQSIGTEVGAIPLYIWEALPNVCSQEMPAAGYADFGFLFEQGNERPIGLTDRTVGVPRAGLNCATCHTGSVRTAPDAPKTILIGAPAHQLDLQRYARFLIACVTGPSYDADRLMTEIDAKHALGPIEKMVYRYLVIPGTYDEVIKLRTRLAWADRRPDFGPGRVDSFNPVKADFNVDMTNDDSIGTADFPSVWNQGVRTDFSLHWDGSNGTTQERNIAATIASGATPDSIDLDELRWTAEFLQTLEPPAYPFQIDEDLAALGQPIFEDQCARCHALEGTQIGRTTDIDQIGTDRSRYDVFTQDMADRFVAIGEGYTWKFKGYRKNTGYQNVLLDAVWARGPYLHNGSVPNLRELLEAPEDRSVTFYRGYDVYDPASVGFISVGPDAEREGVLFDTTLPGNGNAGHLYGVDLAPEAKTALLEFLKGR
jgi:mono/diheme cytochrome c family protein